MAIANVFPRVKQAGEVTASGTIELGAAATGFLGFGDFAADGDRVSYWVTKGTDYQYGGADFATGSPATLNPGSGVLTIATTGDAVVVSCAPQPRAGPELIFAAHVSNYDLTATGFGPGAPLNFATGTIEYDPYDAFITDPLSQYYGGVYLGNVPRKMFRASLSVAFGTATGATTRTAKLTFAPGPTLTLPQTSSTGEDTQSGFLCLPQGSADMISTRFEHNATGSVTVDVGFTVEAFD
jgi:hypothetical protein